METAAADLAKATEGEVVQTEQPLPKEEYEAVLAVMKDLFGKDKKKFTSIQQAFMTQFQVPEGRQVLRGNYNPSSRGIHQWEPLNTSHKHCFT